MLFPTFLVLLGFVPLVFSLPTFPGQADLVTSLPDVTFPVSYKHYSGYLDSLNNRKMHYWFFESQSANPQKDPVALWLNGGPGCSSLMGAFTENGPININANGSFTANPYSWTQKANVIFLETPAGTGFSYIPGAHPAYYPTNDTETVQVNVGALKSFFQKFPHLASNDFYVTGESYAGQYIPQLSVELLKRKFPANFKGAAIGNGLLTRDIWVGNDPSNSTAHFMDYHGMIGSFIDPYNILNNNPDPANALVEWLNKKEVQKEMHIVSDWSFSWSTCSSVDYPMGDGSMAPQIRTMAEAGLKVVIYYGDLDSVCSFVGGKWFVDNDLGYSVVTPYAPWTVNDVVGGFAKTFEKNVVFTTVRGAGHMVPMDQPEAALKIFNEFLLGV